MKLPIIAFLAMVLLLSQNTYALDANGEFESAHERDIFIAKMLQDMAVSINNQAPIPADDGSQITSALAMGKTLNIYTKVLTHSAAEMDSQTFRSFMLSELNGLVCKAKPMRVMIDHGVSYSYFYSGNDNRLITQVTINSYNCN